MKHLFKYLYIFLFTGIIFSCSREKFADHNTDPDAILTIPPEYELATGLLSISNNGNERYYDLYLGIYYWSQTFVLGTGNNEASYEATGNINNRWGNFYSRVGDKLVDIKEIIKKLPPEKQAAYAHLNAIVDIPLAYYAWYTSDVYNSIPYSEAFKARYTIPAFLTPHYDKQEALYDTLDNQLKAAIAVLKAPPPATQVNLSGSDVFFNGDPVKWIKAANSLRLKMALRLMKRNPDKLKAIATEVLNDNVGTISDISEDWKFIGGAGFTGTGDNPANQRPVSGSKNMVDFMLKTMDPRIRIFYSPSPFTKDMFDSAQIQGKIPSGIAWQPYFGQFANPDARLNPLNAPYFTTVNYSYDGEAESGTLPSSVKADFFDCNANSGNMSFPIITYADVCFMKAELAQRGIVGSSSDAEDWYYKGIEASLTDYDQMASLAKVSDYSPLTPEEVSTYKAQPGIVFDPNNALEQICIQQYINYYKNNSEAWAVIKRTGFPSVDGNIMKSEIFSNSGSVLDMPRRFSITPPFVTDLNFDNINAAIKDMVDAGVVSQLILRAAFGGMHHNILLTEPPEKLNYFDGSVFIPA